MTEAAKKSSTVVLKMIKAFRKNNPQKLPLNEDIVTLKLKGADFQAIKQEVIS
jgi:hypothetical protein